MPYIKQMCRGDVTIWQVQTQLTERNIKSKEYAHMFYVYVPLISSKLETPIPTLLYEESLPHHSLHTGRPVGSHGVYSKVMYLKQFNTVLC